MKHGPSYFQYAAIKARAMSTHLGAPKFFHTFTCDLRNPNIENVILPEVRKFDDNGEPVMGPGTKIPSQAHICRNYY